MSPEVASKKKELYNLLDSVSLAGAHRFRRRLKKAASLHALSAIAADMDAESNILNRRRDALPEITYPQQLPVSTFHDEIVEAISNHQVVIIAGETGSGKTTQIPKMCLELGRGIRGRIGHTQPRRLAARTVAERIAEELGQNIGESVGYAIRFDDHVSATTAVKLMTDGILLAEMQRDRYLNAYDTIIIDEAHERSLNIDFLLGYLKQLLPKRPDLKVIITSATIDPERFAEHFADATGQPAPIISVSGRTYPVEIRYRPLQQETDNGIIDIDPLDGVCDAIAELMRVGDGDILCFFPGERDIRDAMEAIEARKFRGVEITPLFGRLSNAEQHRVFSPHSGRRIVLATNIAETSLTVPGIRYVVDTGTARISRYSSRTKVQRLPVEAISQASANQRSGRCGRVAEGVAIRLYSEQDFLSRPEFTDPEILRTNLASVILQMAALKLGDIEDFPFVQAPDHKAIRDGLLLLHELGALAEGEDHGAPRLTDIGRQLSRIPVDPRLARMLVEAHHSGCVADVLVIVAALSIQDVRERPMDMTAQADQAHARFNDKTSDFASYLKLWDYLTHTQQELSGNKFRTRMKKEFLHYLRIREWRDLVRQLTGVIDDLGWSYGAYEPEHHNMDLVHQALLSGLLSHIGVRAGDSREYAGARGTRFVIFPGSGLSKKPPQVVMAGQLVETSRLFARDVAAIAPEWAEQLGKDLLRHQYSEPHWSTKRAAAMVYQKSTLYGVTLVADRLTSLHTVDPEAARSLFIRHALIDGDWNTHHSFFHDNAKKLEEAAELENKARRRDIVVDDDTLYDFYDSKLPPSITTGQRFDRWWKKKQRTQPTLLDFNPDNLIRDDAEGVEEDAFPDKWESDDIIFDVDYNFLPGSPDDGVTIRIPVPLLGSVDAQTFEWLVPGLREELITELIRTLPKALRRTVVPAPAYAARVLPMLVAYHGSVTKQLAEALHRIGGRGIAATDFNPDQLPDHLRPSYAAIDKRGKIIDRDRNLKALKERNAKHISSSVKKVGAAAYHDEAPEWTAQTLGTIPEEITSTVDGQAVTTYPALVATPGGVAVEAKPTKAAADASHLTATITLLLRSITVNTQRMVNGLPLTQRVAVENYPHGGAQGLVDDARVAAIRDSLIAHGGPVRSPEEFATLQQAVSKDVPSRVRQMVVALAPALVTYAHVADELSAWSGPAIDDMTKQLSVLLPPHALSLHGAARLRHLPRYLEAMKIRLEDMDRDPDRDEDLSMTIENVQQLLEQKLAQLGPGAEKTAAVKDIIFMIEELRVSLFAQRLGTAGTVSARRIEKAIAKLG
ncbi:ATP-dependent helicase [Corynebacterium aquilae DSM 44791]|uniref:ATP-dependent helicase n=1 Tax=Corynebacterium aquilae DSM 44791 TaxID=1431546 RepID=A0A1L7CGB8_9CORY|nr:ATP-dependent helicase [Corynebacterium aquilae DSM 44791]